MTLSNSLKSSTTLSTPEDPLKADFRNFLWLIWQYLKLPEPTPIQYDIALWLQHGPRRQITLAFRGVGKSFVTAAYVLWRLYRDPQLKILVVSASSLRAANFSTFVLDLINTIPELAFLIPKEGQRQSKLSFDVAPATPDQSPSVLSLGITSQIAGTRADVIVGDDIEVPNNSDTPLKRDKLSEQVKEFDAVLKPGGQVVYLGTPQFEKSLYNLLQERQYVARIWPARYPGPERIARHRLQLAPMILQGVERDFSLVGQPTDPRRFHEQELQERETSYGRAGFALQFQLDTSLSDAERIPLKLKDLIVFPLDTRRAPVDFMWAASAEQLVELDPVGLPGDRFYRPGWVSGTTMEFEGSMMFIDPSGRGKDETAYAVVKQLAGRLFLAASGGFLGGYEDATLRSLLIIAKKHGVNHIMVEPNYGGGMFTALLQGQSKELYPVSIEDAKWSQAQKEARIIDTLEPILMQHRLVVCPTVIETDLRSVEGYSSERAPEYRLFYQLTRMTRDRGALRHDDKVDALAGAVAYWVEAMAKSTTQASADAVERDWDSVLKRWSDNAKQPGGARPGHQQQGYMSKARRMGRR